MVREEVRKTLGERYVRVDDRTRGTEGKPGSETDGPEVRPRTRVSRTEPVMAQEEARPAVGGDVEFPCGRTW